MAVQPRRVPLSTLRLNSNAADRACLDTGSGSTYIYGWVDERYRPGMNREECLQFVRDGECRRFGLLWRVQ